MSQTNEQIVEEFEEQFVYEDQGPDGDGYDAELPVWSDYFKSGDEYDQIRRIEQWLSEKLSSLRLSTIQEVEEKTDLKESTCKEENTGHVNGRENCWICAQNEIKYQVKQVLASMKGK